MPGFEAVQEAYGETTVVVDREQVREAAMYARDELGFEMCVDLVATDYLGWGTKGVSGYIGTASGRDLNAPMTQGLQALPATKPKRFSVSYHLLALRQDRLRVRLQCWAD